MPDKMLRGRIMFINKSALLFAAALSLMCSTSAIAAGSAYDRVTDAQAMVAQKAIESTLEKYKDDNTQINVYTVDELNTYVENNIHFKIIRDRDKCQFTPDIEDRARIVGMPAFEYVWADMLISGVCVKKDVELGLDYLAKAVEHAYPPAMIRMSDYYERGHLLPRDRKQAVSLMRAAASLGSRTARLAWADMLVRGLGAPAYYEEAYSWLYHSIYFNDYEKIKSDYLQDQMRKMMPANVIARAQADGYYDI